MFFRGETTCILIHFILASFLRTNGLAAQAEKCGGLLHADNGEIEIQPSKSNCLWIIKLKSMTGLSLGLKEFTTEPITVIPAQKSSQANLQSTWMVGPEATYTFEGKIFVILALASPRDHQTSLSWTGLTADFSGVTLNAKFERSLEGSLEWERKFVGVDTTIWAVEPEGIGKFDWEMTSDLSCCEEDSPCQCISFGVIHVMPDGRIDNIHNSCEDSSVGSWTIEKNLLLVLMFTESAMGAGEGSKLRATWKCKEELLKRKVTGIAAATDGGLYIVALNPPKTIQVSSKSVSGVAFDWNSEKIYWAEKGVGIMRANLDGSGSDFEQLIADQLTSGVGIESITGNLYYVSESRKFLRVCNNDAKKCSSIDSLPGFIWDVAFHSPKGFLFWFDADNKRFRANLDGSTAKHIAHQSSYGMDVDECKDRLYTYDHNTYQIISYDLNGQNLRTLRDMYPEPVDLKMDGEKLYYIRKWSSSLRSISPGDARATLVADVYNYPGRIALVGQRLSSARSNPCQEVKCAHLCVLITASSYRCLCQDGKKLQEDGISCS